MLNHKNKVVTVFQRSIPKVFFNLRNYHFQEISVTESDFEGTKNPSDNSKHPGNEQISRSRHCQVPETLSNSQNSKRYSYPKSVQTALLDLRRVANTYSSRDTSSFCKFFLTLSFYIFKGIFPKLLNVGMGSVFIF